MPRQTFVPLLALLGLLALPLAAQAQGPVNGAPPDSAKPAKSPMAEGLPLQPSRVVSFTTDVGSWISVDVSPDGRTLVFDHLGDLYTMPITGGTATPLTRGMAVDAQPRFSPDGSKIVFTSDRSGGEGVWVMSLDRSDTTQLTKGKSDKYDSPEWTPDGKYVVFSKNNQLHMAHVDGGSGTQLIRQTPTPGQPSMRYMGAAFGDDGRYIWYAQRRGSWMYNTPLPDYQLGVYDRETGRDEHAHIARRLGVPADRLAGRPVAGLRHALRHADRPAHPGSPDRQRALARVPGAAGRPGVTRHARRVPGHVVHARLARADRDALRQALAHRRRDRRADEHPLPGRGRAAPGAGRTLRVSRR